MKEIQEIIDSEVQPQKKLNKIGTAGFVLSIIALFWGWVPIVGWILWGLGTVFSFKGIFKKPKGHSIAGLVISFIGAIILIIITVEIIDDVYVVKKL